MTVATHPTYGRIMFPPPQACTGGFTVKAVASPKGTLGTRTCAQLDQANNLITNTAAILRGGEVKENSEAIRFAAEIETVLAR